MRKLIPVILLFQLFALPTYAATKLIVNYNQLVEDLRQGENIHAIISLDKCQPVTQTKSLKDNPDTSGGFTRINFDIFSFYKVQVDDQHQRYAVATSYTILTDHRVFGPVYGYARLRIFDDNTAEFHLAHYDPKTFVLKAEMNFNCRISNGNDQNGVALYEST